MNHIRWIVSTLVVLAVIASGLPQVSALVTTAEAGASPLADAAFAIDTGYRPSVDGYSFKNSFSRPDDNWLVKLGGGRCGGMAYASLDHFYADGTPGSKTGDGALIARRNIDSLVGNGARFVLWTAWSTITGGAHDVTTLTRREELPQLAAALADGPVPLGLIRTQQLAEMKRNHQVVAYRMESDGDVARIWIYDPNHPQADDVVLEVPLSQAGAPIVSMRGTAPYAAWRGLFLERYAPSKAGLR